MKNLEQEYEETKKKLAIKEKLLTAKQALEDFSQAIDDEKYLRLSDVIDFSEYNELEKLFTKAQDRLWQESHYNCGYDGKEAEERNW